MGKPRRYHGEWSPWEVPWVLDVLPWKTIEGLLWDFLKVNPWPYPRPDQSPETQVFGLMSVLGCGLGFAFRKSLGGPSIFSLGSTLSTLWKLHRCSIHHATSSAFPQIVPVYSIQYTTQCTVTSGQVCYWAAHRKLPAAGSCSASLSSGGQLTNSANWNSAN